MTWNLPHQWGKGYLTNMLTEAELRRGGHVHSVSYGGGELCVGGDSECYLFAIQLEEAMEAWSGS